MGEKEPHIPIRRVSQARVDTLSPERRARFDEAATVFSAVVEGVDSPLMLRFAQAAAESFTADIANLLADFQDAADAHPDEL